MTAWDETARRAARDQLRLMGGPCVYTPKGAAALPDQVRVHLIRNAPREKQGVDVVFVERRTEALFLSAEVGKAGKGDSFVAESENWIVEDTIRDDGYVVRVSVKLVS